MKARRFQAFRICIIKDNHTENKSAKQNQIFLRCLALMMNEGKVKKKKTSKPVITVNLTF